VALNFVPHFQDFTVPVLGVGGVCLTWRLLYEFQKVPLPNFLTKLGMVVVAFYLVFQNYGQLLGLEAGSALLICAVSLKLVDGVGYRAAMVLLFLNFMLILARFLESQSLGITIFAGFDLIITTALLVQLHNSSKIKFDAWTLLKTGGKLFLQISPFMILLFFVFPRFSTGFLNAGSNRPALDGFKETMEPGSMARLAQTDQPAFRVRFLGKTPVQGEMYWRGGVLATNFNMKWERGVFDKVQPIKPGRELKEADRYEILLEPVFNDWMFTLDRGIWVEHRNRFLQRNTRILDGGIFALKKAHDNQYLYEGFSVREVKESLSERSRRTYLQAPENTDPRIRELLARISDGSATNEEKAFRLMQFYQGQFRYTLSPGKMQSLELGEFLFEKKQGFCEHFAVSFASLMRLLKVPARVVVGFQGGRRNNLSDYYLVTSKDAHAWTEIWSDKRQQWVRFDPTSMVAPLRFELGGDLFHSMSEEELTAATNREDFLESYQPTWFKQAYFAIDALATNWNLFLLNFDRTGQRDFFAKLGLKNLNQNFLLSVSLLILLSFFLWIRIRHRNQYQRTDPAHSAYLKLRQHLSKRGIEKESFEGPSDFLQRAQFEWPERSKDLEIFRQLYLQDYYGLQDKKQQIQALVKHIR
jgi:transglutaminase-like putative cysteine protease